MSQQTILKINGDRLVDRLKCLGQVGSLDGGGVSRLALTTADREGRDLVVSWMEQLGMTVSIDQIGKHYCDTPRCRSKRCTCHDWITYRYRQNWWPL